MHRHLVGISILGLSTVLALVAKCTWWPWLTGVLERMVSGRAKAHELERLLPWTWKAERLAAAAHA